MKYVIRNKLDVISTDSKIITFNIFVVMICCTLFQIPKRSSIYDIIMHDKNV